MKRQVTVIYATGSGAAVLAAKSATSTIPIVFVLGADPVRLGLAASLNRPGANVTGITFLGDLLIAKRLELLHEIVPTVRTFGFLVNARAPQVDAEIEESQIAVRKLGVNLVIVRVTGPRDFDGAFDTLVEQGAGGLLIEVDTLFGGNQAVQLADLALRHSMPTIYALGIGVPAGFLMSYGPNIADAIHLAGNYVGRILKGEKPVDLPVQQSTRIEMVLNLKTAKALGIEVPTATLLRATEVIE